MAYNNQKKRKHRQTQKAKNVRDHCVSAQKAIQQKQSTNPDTPFSNVVHFRYYASFKLSAMWLFDKETK